MVQLVRCKAFRKVLHGISLGDSDSGVRGIHRRVLISRHPGYFVMSGSTEISVPSSRVSQIWIMYAVLPMISHIAQDNYLAPEPIRLGH